VKEFSGKTIRTGVSHASCLLLNYSRQQGKENVPAEFGQWRNLFVRLAKENSMISANDIESV
jgi:hypothetical protein